MFRGHVAKSDANKWHKSVVSWKPYSIQQLQTDGDCIVRGLYSKIKGRCLKEGEEEKT